MGKKYEERSDTGGLIASALDTLLTPVRILLSPVLLRTYLRTLLLFLTSTALFVLAVLAYTTFYYSYIPVRGISVPVYLQFEHSTLPARNTPQRFPHGTANVKGLVSRQKYDVVVDLVLPRSERNLEAGNWMVGFEMRGPTNAAGLGAAAKGMLGWDEEGEIQDWSQSGEAGTTKEKIPGDPQARKEFTGAGMIEKPTVLARSRRPAILTFRSWMTEIVYTGLRLPLYALGWGLEEEVVKVAVMEGVEFEKGWRNIPTSVKVEIRSKLPLEIYSVGVRFAARLEGLRWFMFHHWLISCVVFTAAFWSVEMGVVLLTWAIFTFLFSSGSANHGSMQDRKRIKTSPGNHAIKSENSDAQHHEDNTNPPSPLSDTPRTFPTLPSHQSLHYTSPDSSSNIKDERSTPSLQDIPARNEDADAEDEEDEDEDADFVLDEPVPLSASATFTDSGFGTGTERGRAEDADAGRSGPGLTRRRSGRK